MLSCPTTSPLPTSKDARPTEPRLPEARPTGFSLLERGWAPPLALLSLVLFLLREAVFFGRVFYDRDIHLQWYGQVESFVRCVAAGSWPLWDPYPSFGQPLLANANNEILYPLTWLNLLVRPWTYYTLFLLVHLLLSGLGVQRLGERLEISRGSSLVAACLWVASGPLLSLGSAWNHLAGAAWIPWVLVCAESALARPGTRTSLTLGALLGLQIVTGSPEMVLLTLLMALALASRHWSLRQWASLENRRSLAAALGAGLFGLAISAGQWLPSLELASRSARWSLGEASRTYWSIHPVGLIELLVPVRWYEFPWSQAWRAALFEDREPFLASIYVGLPALALAAQGIRRRGPGGARLPLLGFGLLATLVSLGKHGPFYAGAAALLPPLRLLRFPAKALVPSSLCLALLAGMGLDEWRSPGARRSSVACGVAALALFATGVLAFVVGFHPERLAAALAAPPPGGYFEMTRLPARRLVWAAGLALMVVALSILRSARGSRGPSVSAALMALLLIADLAYYHRGLNPTAPKEIYTMKPEAAASIDQHDLGRLYVYDYGMTEDRSRRHLGRQTPYLVAGFGRDTPFEWASAFALRMYLVPPVGAAWGIFGSYERDRLSIQEAPLARLNAALVYSEGSPLEARLLRLGAVTEVLALHTAGFEDLEPAGSLPAAFLEPIRLFRVQGALARTYMVGTARIAGGEDALQALLSPDFDERREIVLPSGAPLRRQVADFHGKSRILEIAPDRVRVASESELPGYVVLVDAYDPGWQARVDGRPAPLLRANEAFRAVEVEAGRHEIDFRYRPRAVVGGLSLSGAALLAGATLLLRKRHPSPAP